MCAISWLSPSKHPCGRFISWSSRSALAATSTARTASISTRTSCCRARRPIACRTEVLEEVIRQGIVEQDADTVQFSWHGGEPTLLGLDFFRRVIELEQKYEGGKRVENDLQTNGLLLDDSWCQFLGEHGFLVGLSVNGPKHLHDRFRLTRGGESFFDRTYRAARLLKRHDVAFNTLTVVSSANVRQPDEVYNFLTDDLGCARLQWLPCVEPKDFRTVAPGHWDAPTTPVLGTSAARPGNPDSVVTDWSVDPDNWGEFLCRTFDLWLRKNLGQVLVNWFESVVAQRIGQPPENLHASVRMRAVGHRQEGRQRLRLRPLHLSAVPAGQYPRASARRFRVFRAAEKFGRDKGNLPAHCWQCPYCFACYGECPENRFVKTPDGAAGLNYLCSGLRHFLAHVEPHLPGIIVRPRSIIT